MPRGRVEVDLSLLVLYLHGPYCTPGIACRQLIGRQIQISIRIVVEALGVVIDVVIGFEYNFEFRGGIECVRFEQSGVGIPDARPRPQIMLFLRSHEAGDCVVVGTFGRESGVGVGEGRAGTVAAEAHRDGKRHAYDQHSHEDQNNQQEGECSL